MNTGDAAAGVRERNWRIKANLRGRSIENVGMDESPFFESEVSRRLRDFRQARAIRMLPEMMEIIETKLTQRQRDAIIWFYALPRQNKRQVGDLMGIDRTTVLRHIEWGLKKIRKHLGAKVE